MNQPNVTKILIVEDKSEFIDAARAGLSGLTSFDHAIDYLESQGLIERTSYNGIITDATFPYQNGSDKIITLDEIDIHEDSRFCLDLERGLDGDREANDRKGLQGLGLLVAYEARKRNIPCLMLAGTHSPKAFHSAIDLGFWVAVGPSFPRGYQVPPKYEAECWKLAFHLLQQVKEGKYENPNF